MVVVTLIVTVLGLSVGTASGSASSLRYFGYFAARLTAAGGNHLPEVAGRSNMNWVQISDPGRYASEVLDSCAPGSCIVNTGFEFFKGCEEVHSAHCELYPDYQARWETLVAAIGSRIEKVGAFYLLDEPQWHGASVAQLETAAQTIKRTFPTIPVMMVEAGPMVTATLQIPAAVDWVGFDWYCQPFSTVEHTLATLSGRIHPNQSLYLLMESAVLPECGGQAGHATDAQIAALQNEYFRLAQSNPQVIGLLAFGFWTSGLSSAQLPLTVAAHEAIYRAIIPPALPPPPAPPPLTSSPIGHPVHFIGAPVVGRKGGQITIHIGCPKANPSPCAGSVSMRLTQHKPRPLGSSEFAVEPGHRAAVDIPVKRQLRRALRAHGPRPSKQKVRATAVTSAGESTQVFTVRQAPRPRHHHRRA
jgi:hypothetical protein